MVTAAPSMHGKSADTGEEVTPPFVVAPDGEIVRILARDQEQHISADVAFGVWKYWEATGDERFLLEAGAEILDRDRPGFGKSRGTRGGWPLPHSWGDRARRVSRDGKRQRLHKRNGAVEPRDRGRSREPRCRKLADTMASTLKRLGLQQEEPQRWLKVARDLYTGFDAQTGLFEQFQGYFGLEDIDLALFAARTSPMDVLLGHNRIQRSKVIKQPDVVMLINLLWERLPPEVRKANFEYYEPRCGHGSSLSPAIHALVAARLGDVVLAERYFRQAADIDLADKMGNAAGGVHAGALGGLWQAVVFGFAGLRPSGERPEHCSHLPPSWRSVSVRFQWRGRPYELAAPEGVQEIPKTGDDP